MSINKKIIVVFEDDWEVKGTGLGHVTYRQYLPVKAYLKILKKYNIKVTFYVDYAQYFFLERYQKDRDIYMQMLIWDETVRSMIIDGHDVQLHLHPQWFNAEFNNGMIYTTDKWNIASLKSSEQQILITRGISHINQLYSSLGFAKTVTAFKAGSWGIQPSQEILNNLFREGINVVMGPVKNTFIPKLNVDFRTLESPTHSYYCDYLDINKVSKDKDNKIMVIPITPVKLNLVQLIKFITNRGLEKYISKYDHPLDIDDTTYNNQLPMSPISRDKKSLFWTHLRINNYPFWYLKSTFDIALNALEHENMSHDHIPLIYETHTKLFKNHFKDIDRFFNYLTTKYNSRIEFMTVIDYYKYLTMPNAYTRTN
jgi:hypothetical protein